MNIRSVWSVFAVRMMKAWVLSYPLSAQWRLWSDWVDAEAESLPGEQSFCWFCQEAAHIYNFYSMNTKSKVTPRTSAEYVLIGGQLFAPHTRAKWIRGSGSARANFSRGSEELKGLENMPEIEKQNCWIPCQLEQICCAVYVLLPFVLNFI